MWTLWWFWTTIILSYTVHYKKLLKSINLQVNSLECRSTLGFSLQVGQAHYFVRFLWYMRCETSTKWESLTVEEAKNVIICFYVIIISVGNSFSLQYSVNFCVCFNLQQSNTQSITLVTFHLFGSRCCFLVLVVSTWQGPF